MVCESRDKIFRWSVRRGTIAGSSDFVRQRLARLFEVGHRLFDGAKYRQDAG